MKDTQQPHIDFTFVTAFTLSEIQYLVYKNKLEVKLSSLNLFTTYTLLQPFSISEVHTQLLKEITQMQFMDF